MFIDENEVVDISVLYKKNGRRYEAYTESEFKSLKLEEKEVSKYATFDAKMKELTWGMYNTLQEVAMIDDGSGMGDRQFNYQVYKENRLLKLLLSWCAKDKEGKPVPIDRKNICKLAPSIAEAILRAYDEESFLNEESEKN